MYLSAERTWREYVERPENTNVEEFLLFADSLHAQRATDFKVAMKGLRTLVWHGPTGCTDLWQPVDQGLGRAIKLRMGKLQQAWLEDAENERKWVEDDLTASQRRVLLTQWYGCAVQEVFARGDMERFFEKGGCLVTVDGSADDRIMPDGIVGYRLDRTRVADPALEIEINKYDRQVVAAAAHANSDDEEQDGEGADTWDDSGEGLLERPFEVPSDHRIAPPLLLDASLIGKKILFLWDVAGWCLGTVTKHFKASKTRFNYQLRYDDGDQYHGLSLETCLRTEEEVAEAQVGAWVLLEECE